jgi:hypothetical protein
MTAVSEVYGAAVLALITMVVTGLFLVIYYSLGILFLALFLFLLFLFVFRGTELTVNFRSYD